MHEKPIRALGTGDVALRQARVAGPADEENASGPASAHSADGALGTQADRSARGRSRKRPLKLHARRPPPGPAPPAAAHTSPASTRCRGALRALAAGRVR